MKRTIGPGEVVAMFIVGLFCAGLLIFTGIANLKLLTGIYPDPEFVGFGLLALEGGTVVWTIVAFLTNKHSAHFGICILGLAVDTLLSCTGFMYELSARTGQSLPIELPVIYVVGFAVIINVGFALCYKLIPKRAYGNLIPMPYYEQSGNLIPLYAGGETARPLTQSNQPKEERILDNTGQLPAIQPPAQQEPRQLKRLPAMRAESQPGYSLGELLREGVGLLTSKARKNTALISKVAPAPGSPNGTTNGNM